MLDRQENGSNPKREARGPAPFSPDPVRVTMNIDEATFLTAYLDGELDADQRRRVESALLADAGLVDDLGDLSSVRDLIAGLGRPQAPVDVSGRVVASIRRQRSAGSWRARGVALASAAAALVAIASGGLGQQGVDLGQRPIGAGRGHQPIVRATLPEKKKPIVVAAKETTGDPRSERPGRLERRLDRERQQMRDLLESPNLSKILLVTDVLGGEATREVGDLIEKTPRRNATYGRMVITQGIILDPEHPGQATVFAVVVDDRELAQLYQNLEKSFPKGVQDVEPRPEVVTNLAEVGQVSVFAGTGSNVANLLDPSELVNTALKSEPRRPADLTRIVPEVDGVDPLLDNASNPLVDNNLADPDVSNKGPRNRDQNTARSPTVPFERRSPPEPSVVLVWVTSSRKAGPP